MKCPECKTQGEHKKFDRFEYWYCSSCKDEITLTVPVVEECKSDIEFDENGDIKIIHSEKRIEELKERIKESILAGKTEKSFSIGGRKYFSIGGHVHHDVDNSASSVEGRLHYDVDNSADVGKIRKLWKEMLAGSKDKDKLRARYAADHDNEVKCDTKEFEKSLYEVMGEMKDINTVHKAPVISDDQEMLTKAVDTFYEPSDDYVYKSDLGEASVLELCDELLCRLDKIKNPCATVHYQQVLKDLPIVFECSEPEPQPTKAKKHGDSHIPIRSVTFDSIPRILEAGKDYIEKLSPMRVITLDSIPDILKGGDDEMS